jgi:hypothetical protein
LGVSTVVSISINTQDFMHTTTDRQQLAAVGGNLFGAILVNAHEGEATSFATSVSYMSLTNIRFPGGQVSETGAVTYTGGGMANMGMIDGGNQTSWISGPVTASNYAYDLRYPDLVNPALLASDTDIMSFSEALALAKAMAPRPMRPFWTSAMKT